MIYIFSNVEDLKQFTSYFFIGGFSAIIEWVSFFILNQGINIHFINATIIAFLLSTYTNWIIGRNTIFKDFKDKKNIIKEITSIYFVSGFGLIINILVMFVLVKVFYINPMISKIIGTGLVFLWNFTIRKKIIYKN